MIGKSSIIVLLVALALCNATAKEVPATTVVDTGDASVDSGVSFGDEGDNDGNGYGKGKNGEGHGWAYGKMKNMKDEEGAGVSFGDNGDTDGQGYGKHGKGHGWAYGKKKDGKGNNGKGNNGKGSNSKGSASNEKVNPCLTDPAAYTLKMKTAYFASQNITDLTGWYCTTSNTLTPNYSQQNPTVTDYLNANPQMCFCQNLNTYAQLYIGTLCSDVLPCADAASDYSDYQ